MYGIRDGDRLRDDYHNDGRCHNELVSYPLYVTCERYMTLRWNNFMTFNEDAMIN